MTGQDAIDAAARRIAVVIPCYRAARTIAGVLAAIGPEVDAIYCVDDASRDGTVEAVTLAMRRDPRIRLMLRPANGGVGAATVDGYRAAIADGASVLVKLDADGQMDPACIADFAAPVLAGEADYVKGNRFFDVQTLSAMPARRIIGNAGLSFLTKLSTGYWDLFDPVNGYTALHADVAALLPLERLHQRYFFESDMLFRLGLARARVVELPLAARYGQEASHLSELRCLVTFPGLHLRNLAKRVVYSYFLRNFSAASLNLVVGMAAAGFGLVYGIDRWIAASRAGTVATAGTVMLSALPLLLGIQLLLSFLAYDMAMTPREAIHRRLSRQRVLAAEARRAAQAAGVADQPLPPEELRPGRQGGGRGA
jgi:glycosyltransferase involved in cell wall biosynthesis